MTTAQDLVNYYANLLILQYVGKPKAYAHMQALIGSGLMLETTTQVISFASAPASGNFQLQYGVSGPSTGLLAWNAGAGTIESALQALTGLSQVTVSGSIAGLALTVTFTGVIPPASPLHVIQNTLGVSVSVSETDTETIPLSVQNAFDLGTAVGVQLDTIGKYAGVVRTGNGFSGPITLDDNDFTSLIKMAIIRNMAGSSLATIQSLLNTYFPSEIFVFDHQNMQMGYMMSSSVGSQNLAQLFVEEDLLPKPMGVELAALIYIASLSIFGMISYGAPPPTYSAAIIYSFGDEAMDSGIVYDSLQNGNLNHSVSDTAWWRVVIYPFNNYSSYNSTWTWLSYADAIVI